MKSVDLYRLDSAETIYFERELEHVKASTYDTKQRPLKAFTLIPVSSEVSNAAGIVTWRSYTMVGVAKVIHDYANDFPNADAYGVEQSIRPKSLGAGYQYSIQEIRESQYMGKGLDTRKAIAARRAIEQKMDSIAWNGDSETGLNGLINYPGISEYTVPNDGTGASKLWTTKTPDKIVRDVAGHFNFMVEATNGIEVPNTWILPQAKYNYLITTRMGDGSDKTIMTFLKENILQGVTVEWVTELKNAGLGGAIDRSIFYVRDPMHLTLEVPQQFETFPQPLDNMVYKFACHARIAGVIVYYPASVCFADGF